MYSGSNKKNRWKASRRDRLLNVAARSWGAREGRGRRWIVWYVWLPLLVCAAAAWFTRESWLRVALENSETFVIRHIEVTTDGRLEAENVKEYAGISEGDPLFAVGMDEIRDRLLLIPVVEDVRVWRQLPDTVRVDIAERIAVARLGLPGMSVSLAVDAKGHVLGPSSANSGLPLISGVRDRGLRPGATVQDSMLMDALSVLELSTRAEFYSALQVASIDVSNPETLNVLLASGERVLLLRDTAIERLKTLPRMMKRAKERGVRLSEYDLTVRENFPALPAR